MTVVSEVARCSQLTRAPKALHVRAGAEGEGRSSPGSVLGPCDLDSSADRVAPVDLLEEQALTRVPELVPIRYGRMVVSPFSYFRGAALPMAADLATTPVTGINVQLCGDAHMSNFGVFGSPERHLIFDLNDFDETAPGPMGVGRQEVGREH